MSSIKIKTNNTMCELPNGLNYQQIQQWLSRIFGSAEYKLSYTDDEGDNIIVTSDLELQEALKQKLALKASPNTSTNAARTIPHQRQHAPSNIFANLRHCHHTPAPGLLRPQRPQPQNQHPQPNAPSNIFANLRHCHHTPITPTECPRPIPGGFRAIAVQPQSRVPRWLANRTNYSKINNTVHAATCDGCKARIVGIRYKCANCPDYDLCASCEHVNTFGTKQIHDATHVFLKITRPIPFKHFAPMEKLYHEATAPSQPQAHPRCARIPFVVHAKAWQARRAQRQNTTENKSDEDKLTILETKLKALQQELENEIEARKATSIDTTETLAVEKEVVIADQPKADLITFTAEQPKEQATMTIEVEKAEQEQEEELTTSTSVDDVQEESETAVNYYEKMAEEQEQEDTTVEENEEITEEQEQEDTSVEENQEITEEQEVTTEEEENEEVSEEYEFEREENDAETEIAQANEENNVETETSEENEATEATAEVTTNNEADTEQFQYEDKVQQLQTMGFEVNDQVKSVIVACKGDLPAIVEILLQ